MGVGIWYGLHVWNTVSLFRCSDKQIKENKNEIVYLIQTLAVGAETHTKTILKTKCRHDVKFEYLKKKKQETQFQFVQGSIFVFPTSSYKQICLPFFLILCRHFSQSDNV